MPGSRSCDSSNAAGGEFARELTTAGIHLADNVFAVRASRQQLLRAQMIAQIHTESQRLVDRNAVEGWQVDRVQADIVEQNVLVEKIVREQHDRPSISLQPDPQIRQIVSRQGIDSVRRVSP